MPVDFKDQKRGTTDRKTANERGKPPRLVGVFWQILGVFLFIVGAIIFMVNQSLTSGYFIKWGTGILAWILASICMLGGIGLFNHGRKYSAPGARKVFAQDKRKPVIYLRSFRDDEEASKAKPPTVWKTEEEQVAYVMNEIGPFIAIGDPRDENLPDLGAARVYLGDHEWQRTVSVLTSHAQLVVLRAGDTPGFWWEVKRVSKSVKPERLLFLIPYDKQQYDAFCRKANPYFPKPLPEYTALTDNLLSFISGKSVADTGSLRGVIYFEKDWTPRFAALKRLGWRQANDQFVLSNMLRFAIRPVFEQLQIPYGPSLTRYLMRIAKSLILAILVFAIAFLACFISYKLSNP